MKPRTTGSRWVLNLVSLARDLDFIKRNLKGEIYVYAYDQDQGEKVRAETDPDVQAAVDLLPKAQQLTEQASRLMAQRTGR